MFIDHLNVTGVLWAYISIGFAVGAAVFARRVERIPAAWRRQMLLESLLLCTMIWPLVVRDELLGRRNR